MAVTPAWLPPVGNNDVWTSIFIIPAVTCNGNSRGEILVRFCPYIAIKSMLLPGYMCYFFHMGYEM
ncbi:hypothetical protein CBFG_01369 [Clostridiales bacterium 1_7_47FAA]|nr:hypothetical protein CBFG_01369 [Clostridiales bacterium 1_7_47FAA]